MDHPRKIIGNAYDRIQEAHWNMHQMEMYFHESDAFRYSLNSFLRVIKEVPQLLQMELQNHEGFSEWFKSRKEETLKDPLISDLFKKRDIVVHRSTLKPKSSAYLGVARGRKLKSGFSMQLDPFEDSDIVLVDYLFAIKDKKDDILGITIDDEDTLPCVERHWRLEPFNEDILTLATNAFQIIALLLSDTIVWLGGEHLDTNLKCIHDSSKVNIRFYSRDWIKQALKNIRDGNEYNSVLRLISELRNKR